MSESLSSSFLVGFLVYQAIITLGVVGYVLYLSLSFANYRNMVAKAFAELLKQDEELAKRIQQVAGAFMLMDTLFPQQSTPQKPTTKKKDSTLKPLHNFAKDTKDRSHLSVIDNPSKTDTPAVPSTKQEESSNDKSD